MGLLKDIWQTLRDYNDATAPGETSDIAWLLYKAKTPEEKAAKRRCFMETFWFVTIGTTLSIAYQIWTGQFP